MWSTEEDSISLFFLVSVLLSASVESSVVEIGLGL